MRISDWSSDVCSSDLGHRLHRRQPGILVPRPARIADQLRRQHGPRIADLPARGNLGRDGGGLCPRHRQADRRVRAFDRRPAARLAGDLKSEERRVGKECVRPCSFWWWTYTYKKKIETL